MIVKGVPLGPINKDSTGLIEAHSLFTQRKGVMVANALVSPRTGTVPVRLANPFVKRCQINKQTLIATYETNKVLNACP